MKKNERYWWHNQEVLVINSFTFKDREWFVITDNDGYFQVISKEELKPFEQSWSYKRQETIKKEIEALELTKKNKIDEIKKKAVESLSFRLKINTVFGKDAKLTDIGLVISQELEKLIDDTNM